MISYFYYKDKKNKLILGAKRTGTCKSKQKSEVDKIAKSEGNKLKWKCFQRINGEKMPSFN